jgi:hypothetical protein
VHTLIVFNKYTVLCAHFSSKSLNTSQQTAPYGPPLLAIQAARGPPNQAFPSLTVILQGGYSGLSAGPVFRVMACPEHHAFRAHMEPTFVLTWNPLVCTVCTDGAKCAQCAQRNANCVESVQIVTILCTLFTKYFRHVSASLEIGRLHSHDPWAGGGATGLENWSMSRHAFLHPDPLNTIANCLLLATTADHLGSKRAPQSGFSFLQVDSNTTRWLQWIISRACLSGDGVPGTSRFSCSHGTNHVT